MEPRSAGSVIRRVSVARIDAFWRLVSSAQWCYDIPDTNFIRACKTPSEFTYSRHLSCTHILPLPQCSLLLQLGQRTGFRYRAFMGNVAGKYLTMAYQRSGLKIKQRAPTDSNSLTNHAHHPSHLDGPRSLKHFRKIVPNQSTCQFYWRPMMTTVRSEAGWHLKLKGMIQYSIKMTYLRCYVCQWQCRDSGHPVDTSIARPRCFHFFLDRTRQREDMFICLHASKWVR